MKNLSETKRKRKREKGRQRVKERGKPTIKGSFRYLPVCEKQNTAVIVETM